jgi:predicted aspartyl protease
MARRLFGTVNCYPHDTVANQPRLRIRLFNVAKEQWPEDLLVPVDTGFSGAIMLPSSSYDFFMIGELPKKLWKDYRTMTGPVQMRVARAFVETEQVSAETLVETPLVGAGKLLIGRGILKDLAVLLDGPAKLSCMMKPQDESGSV